MAPESGFAVDRGRVPFPSRVGRGVRRNAADWNVESAIAGMIIRGVRVLTGIQARWIGCEPVGTQRIYFANHTSHLDAVLLWASLPPRLRKRTRPVAAHDYWQEGPVRRYLAERVFRGVFVQRDCADPSINRVAPMLDALEEGDSLILFPEGTRGNGEDVRPFKSGLFHVACERPGLEFVPVWLDNSYRVMPKGSVLPLPLLCTATFGRPSQIGANEEKAAFLDRLRRSLLDASRV